MLDKLDYSLVPNDFALCFNGKCLHASTCLRHQVSRHIPKERWAVRAINPERVVPDGDCSRFMDDSPLKNAYVAASSGTTPMWVVRISPPSSNSRFDFFKELSPLFTAFRPGSDRPDRKTVCSSARCAPSAPPPRYGPQGYKAFLHV